MQTEHKLDLRNVRNGKIRIWPACGTRGGETRGKNPLFTDQSNAVILEIGF